MKVLSNLLTVLAALLNLASGCGLRGRGAGQGLVQLGNALAQQRFSSVSNGGALAAVGAVLGGTSSGRLLSGLSHLRAGTLGGGLTSGASGLGSGGASSGLQALGAITGRLGGTSGGALLAGIASGSSTGISGGHSGLLLTGLPQAGQTVGGGFLATTTSTRSSTTSVGLRSGGNAAGNLLGLVATTGGGHPAGVPSIPGGQPAFGGQVTGQEGMPGSPGAVPAAGQPDRMPGSLGGLPGVGLHESVSSSSSLSATSVSASGGNSMQVPGQPLQQNRPELAGGSPGAGGIATQLATVSAARYVGSTVQNMGLAASPNGGGSGGILPSEVGAAGSPRPGIDPAALPGTQPAAGVPGGSGIGGIATRMLHGGGSTGIGVLGSSNSVSGTGLLDVQGLGQGTHQNGRQLGATISTAATSTLRTASAVGAQMAGRSTGTLLGVVPSLTGGVPGAVSPGGSMGPGSSPVGTESGLLDVQGLGQGTHQNRQQLRATIGTAPTSTLQTASAVGADMEGRSTATLLGVVPSLTGGVSGAVSPGGSMGPGSRPVGTGTGLLDVQGHGQGTHQNGQQLGATISTAATSTLRTASAVRAQMAGRNSGTLLGVVPSLTGGVPGAVSPGGSMGPGSSPVGTVLPRQGLGQSADQVSQSIGGTYVGGASTIQQSTTRHGTQLPGSSPGSGVLPGGIPGQGPLQGTQPVSQMPGGVSRVTVTASSQSSSSFRSQTHFLRGSQGSVGAGLPSLGGLGSGIGVPMGAPGSGATGAGAGTESALLNRIVAAAGAGHPQGGPGQVVQGGLGVISSNVRTGSLSTGMVSGVAHPVQRHHRRTPSAAAAAGLALGTVAGALAITAIGTGLASALQNGAAGGGRRIGGCSGGRGCSSGCGRRRRSIPQSKVPAEVLNEIPTNFERLY